MSTYTCTTAEQHCEQCGAIVGRDCGEWEGYTSCCNELATFGGFGCRGYHVEAEAMERTRPAMEAAMAAAGLTYHDGDAKIRPALVAAGLPADAVDWWCPR